MWNTSFVEFYYEEKLHAHIEELEYTKGVIKIRKSKNRQHNGQKTNDKGTKNDLQYTTQLTTDKATRTLLTNLGWTQVLRKGGQFVLQ